jgi:hypothetical protein
MRTNLFSLKLAANYQMRRIFAAQFRSIPVQYFGMISIILGKLQSQFQRQEKFML